MRHRLNEILLNTLPQLLQPFRKRLPLRKQHIPFTQPHLDVCGKTLFEHVVWCQAGGGVGGAVVAVDVGWGEVGEVEEVGEEFWEAFRGVEGGALLFGAGDRPVEEGVPGDYVEDFEVEEGVVGCGGAGDVGGGVDGGTGVGAGWGQEWVFLCGFGKGCVFDG